MAERTILFSAPMVQAILAGNKTQTRRNVKFFECESIEQKEDGSYGVWSEDTNVCGGDFWRDCPHGQVGDRLWVRETWATKIKTVGNTPHETVVYRATEPNAVECYDCNGNELPVKWRSSIHMPRWASRILLEITGVRVERLHDISEQDAIAEGVYNRENYFHVWECINGRESLDANPWVWVITFKVAEIK